MIMTSSLLVGAAPPTQVAPVVQLPLAAEVTNAAATPGKDTAMHSDSMTTAVFLIVGTSV
jgi:hypothetical protein